ncbi:MAG: helix-turn-helix domain-containing protein [Cyanothece sp. SIO2G6]|nr:helix-turn-helix domain-containing protein [Cyanothece sp. SIO2G6]
MSSRAKLAQRSNRDNATLTRWICRYKESGLSGYWRSATPIQGTALETLLERLAQPDRFRSYGEIQQWLAQACDLAMNYATLFLGS